MGWPFGESVTQHVAGTPTRDVDGNDVDTFTDVEHTGVSVSPRESTEMVDNRATNVIGLSLAFKPWITVGPLDEFTVRGERYRVDGMPSQYKNPFTSTTITRVTLTRATG